MKMKEGLRVDVESDVRRKGEGETDREGGRLELEDEVSTSGLIRTHYSLFPLGSIKLSKAACGCAGIIDSGTALSSTVSSSVLLSRC